LPNAINKNSAFLITKNYVDLISSPQLKLWAAIGQIYSNRIDY